LTLHPPHPALIAHASFQEPRRKGYFNPNYHCMTLCVYLLIEASVWGRFVVGRVSMWCDSGASFLCVHISRIVRQHKREIFSLILHCVVELEHASVAQALSSF
jgi:hypothetical protein